VIYYFKLFLNSINNNYNISLILNIKVDIIYGPIMKLITFNFFCFEDL